MTDAATLVAFVRELRAAGMRVTPGQTLTYCQAVARLVPADGVDLYWAGRACLVAGEADLAVYDAVFDRFFAGGGAVLVTDDQSHRTRLMGAHAVPMDVGEQREGEDDVAGAAASPAEALRRKRFADLSAEEHAAMRALLRRFRLEAPVRRSRRTAPGPRGAHPDLRRTIRRSLRTHGELVEREWRRRRHRPRRLVLLLDVSGSMSHSSRSLLQFAWSGVRTAPGVEVYCFGTRLTRVTEQLRHLDPDAALAEAAERVLDWDGGTRIGESIDEFVRTAGRLGLSRGAVVVICSDGLERGDPATLSRAMARLARLSHRIVWVNPLKADPAYEPLTRGMQAALPHIDVLVSGHSLASLEELAGLLPTLR